MMAFPVYNDREWHHIPHLTNDLENWLDSLPGSRSKSTSSSSTQNGGQKSDQIESHVVQAYYNQLNSAIHWDS